jgi:hypothetical protein
MFQNQWKLIGIMDFPVPNVTFNYGQTLFQEDWLGNGQDVREARVKMDMEEISQIKMDILEYSINRGARAIE